jgi:NAD(P)H-flavin reductase
VPSGFGLIAGGVGIAVLISMLRTMADRHDVRPVVLVYGNRDWDGVAFREELEELEDRLNLSVVHVLSGPPAEWPGETGRVRAEVLARHLPPGYRRKRAVSWIPRALAASVLRLASALLRPPSSSA